MKSKVMFGLLTLATVALGSIVVSTQSVQATYGGHNGPKKVASVTVVVSPATCTSAEKISDIVLVNAKLEKDSARIGATGPKIVEVEAEATNGARFADGEDEWEKKIKLGGRLTGEQCIATAAAPTTIAPTCELGEKLVLGAITKATFSGTEDGVTGPGSYNVIATANEGMLFANKEKTISFEGTLADKLPAQDTNPKGDCYVQPGSGEVETPETPVTPETPKVTTPVVLPKTSSSATSAVAAGAVSIAMIILVAAGAIKSRFVL